MRQTHHWAANVFVVAIVLHLVRIFFTGAFRKPRELNYLDRRDAAGRWRCSRASSATRCSTTCSRAWAWRSRTAWRCRSRSIGGDVAHLLWGGEFPGDPRHPARACSSATSSCSRRCSATLIAIHLALDRPHAPHAVPRPAGAASATVVGSPMWPGYALRSLGAARCSSPALLFALGGLVQINPIWQWGPYEPWLGHQRRAARLVSRLADRRAAARCRRSRS